MKKYFNRNIKFRVFSTVRLSSGPGFLSFTISIIKILRKAKPFDDRINKSQFHIDMFPHPREFRTALYIVYDTNQDTDIIRICLTEINLPYTKQSIGYKV